MIAKTIIVLCAQTVFIRIALSQKCTSRAVIDASQFSSPYGTVGFTLASPAITYDGSAPAMAYNGWTGSGLPCDGYFSTAKDFTITNGGGLPVTSISSISPTGIFIKSDNSYEGPVIVSGELPFISAVVMEGKLPTNGAGTIQYGCGNGLVAMLTEGPAVTTSGAIRPGAYSPGPNVAFSAGGGFDTGLTLGLGNGFGPATGSGRSAGFANANRLGSGGCGCGILY